MINKITYDVKPLSPKVKLGQFYRWKDEANPNVTELYIVARTCGPAFKYTLICLEDGNTFGVPTDKIEDVFGSCEGGGEYELVTNAFTIAPDVG